MTCEHYPNQLVLCLHQDCGTPLVCQDCLVDKHQHNYKYYYRNLTRAQQITIDFQEVVAERARLSKEVKIKSHTVRETVLKNLEMREKRNFQELDRIFSRQECEELNAVYSKMMAERLQPRVVQEEPEPQSSAHDNDSVGVIQPSQDRATLKRRLKQFEIRVVQPPISHDVVKLERSDDRKSTRQ